MSSLFTKIISGELPSHKLFEDDTYLAFLDIRPINPGHALVIPKKEIDYIFDLDEHLLKGIMPFAKKIALAIEKAVPCKRIGIMVAGLEVPHTHIHLIPIIEGLYELSFSNAKSMANEELKKLAEKIKTYL